MKPMERETTPLENLKSKADEFQKEILERIECGEYDLIPALGNYSPLGGVYSDEVLAAIFPYLPETEESYNAIIRTWTNSKGGFPEWIFDNLSEWVQWSWLKELPPPYFNRDFITVYRGGAAADEDTLSCTPAWTIDKKVALWFYARLQKVFEEKHSEEKSHLYKAKLAPWDIIAYTEERNEQEIIQYRGVYNIEEIPVFNTELKEALEERASHINKPHTSNQHKKAYKMLTDKNIEGRIRYRLKKHGLKMHKVNNYGNAWYQILEIDEDPKDHKDDEYGWFTLDKALNYAEELAEKEHAE